MSGLIRKFFDITASAPVREASEGVLEAARTVTLRRRPMPALRNFKAAASDRLQASWNPSGHSNDSAVRMGLRKMRARSREQFYDNEYAKHFYRLLKSNVIGPDGIRLQAKAKDPGGALDRDANQKIESSFKKWGKRGVCDVTGKHSWVDVQRLALETVARDGEVLIRKVRGYPNAFGFALQLIEADHLDETFNGVLPNGNTIRMSIEFDKWDRAVAFHLLSRNPGDYIYGHLAGKARDRVPADEIIHLFMPEFVRQSRGIPWLHAGLSRLRKMGSYEEAELIASLLGASKMGFYEPDHEADPKEFEGEDGESEGEFVEEAEAGTFGIIPYGYKFKAFDPQHPSGNYDLFMKRMMRAFSAGAGMNYCSLGNDISEVNFSSIRFGAEEDRDIYKAIQGWLSEWLCDDVANEWLPAAMLSGQVPLPFARLEKFKAFVWRPRRWKYVNPLQDATAKQKELESGGTTLTDLHAEKGSDYEEYLETLAEEERLEAEYKVKPPSKRPTPGQAP